MNPPDSIDDDVVSTVDAAAMMTLRKEREFLEEQSLANNNFIEEKVIPRLEEAIRNGNGSYSSFHLWEKFDPEFRNKEPAPQERRRMQTRNKERKTYEHKFGNTPLIIGGVSIGMMITRVPWLLPEAFEGLGVPLSILDKQPLPARNPPLKRQNNANGRVIPPSRSMQGS